jgi:hypothetical protein
VNSVGESYEKLQDLHSFLIQSEDFEARRKMVEIMFHVEKVTVDKTVHKNKQKLSIFLNQNKKMHRLSIFCIAYKL